MYLSIIIVVALIAYVIYRKKVVNAMSKGNKAIDSIIGSIESQIDELHKGIDHLISHFEANTKQIEKLTEENRTVMATVAKARNVAGKLKELAS
jgi:cell shape-determining protein MreC